jgi:hypothetical protein
MAIYNFTTAKAKGVVRFATAATADTTAIALSAKSSNQQEKALSTSTTTLAKLLMPFIEGMLQFSTYE